MIDVLAFGEMLVDFTVSTGGQRFPSIQGDAGGAPANVLVSVAKLGGRSRFMGMVGDDAFGAFLQTALGSAGVDTSFIRKTSQALTTMAFVQLDADGERSFTFMRSPGADQLFQVTDLPVNAFVETRVFHFGSLSLTAEPARSATLFTAQKAREAGLLVSYDPNWRAPLWANQAIGIAGMRLGLPYADIVKVSEEELLLLTNEADIGRAAKSLLALGPQFIVVTRGSAGCYFCTETATGEVAAPVVQAVDTTGAGDAFLGGLLYRLCHEDGPLQAIPAVAWLEHLRFANAVGALTTAQFGTFSAMPTLEAVEQLLREQPR